MELLSRRDTGRTCVLLFALVVGCTGETRSAPSILIDGSRTRPPTVALEGLDVPSITSKVRIVPRDFSDADSSAASCMAAIGAPARGTIVERVGVEGRSVSFFGGGRRTAHACDGTYAGGGRATWCGHAFDRVASGRLRDPRLSLSCRASDGDPVGFAWIQPEATTTYVVVRQRGYAEVYTVATDVPVRVTTTDTELTTSRAAFAISEHAFDGRRVRSYNLEAQVAG